MFDIGKKLSDKMPEETVTITLTKKQDKVLNILFQIAMMEENRDTFIFNINELDAKDAMSSLLGQLSDKTHAIGWCEDPNCAFEKKV